MMVSIDGKIEGYFADAPLTGACGDYYEEVIPKLGDAHGTGSYTACLYMALYMAQADVDYDAFKDTPVEDGDFIVKNEEGKYLFVFDRHGKCNWDDAFSGGMQIVEVLTRTVRKEYLAYLRSKNISYIFAGENDLEPEHSLEKMKAYFGIHTLVLCGGATINGVFLKAGMVDGISEVIVPHVEGNHDQKGIAETNVFVPDSFPLKKVTQLPNGGVHLVFEKK